MPKFLKLQIENQNFSYLRIKEENGDFGRRYRKSNNAKIPKFDKSKI